MFTCSHIMMNGQIVDTNFRCFEKNRVVEIKVCVYMYVCAQINPIEHPTSTPRLTQTWQCMLEEVLRAEMLYHCRAIEILEPLCVSMRRLNPDRAMEVS